ncbi:GNAT family N-acetyltransferase [Parapedobacter koreensis]|uniref:Acetyltransferase (GNAT) domain-containing protein n=1 Tax=Parapedobacter koreensis TaxID=332977 RepID=A0A1H7TQY9_9SPHI|nr:GNAT family N-acetyltransferase [Parapedobacter koreensis]SEL87181.1 Acetyltransferase (GNAT) domain-containing protein [Parapedobacter koreensis]
MIKFIDTEDTLPLRSLVLRNGAPLANCHFQGDDSETTFHMGYVANDQDTVCILTCQLEPLEDYQGVGYRLRGMATHPDWQGKRIGSQLLNAAINHLAVDLTADYLWCNARRVAYDFYRHLGFDMISEEFEIPGIGPHKVMYLGLG